MFIVWLPACHDDGFNCGTDNYIHQNAIIKIQATPQSHASHDHGRRMQDQFKRLARRVRDGGNRLNRHLGCAVRYTLKLLPPLPVFLDQCAQSLCGLSQIVVYDDVSAEFTLGDFLPGIFQT